MTGKEMSFDSELPIDMKKNLRTLKKQTKATLKT